MAIRAHESFGDCFLGSFRFSFIYIIFYFLLVDGGKKEQGMGRRRTKLGCLNSSRMFSCPPAWASALAVARRPVQVGLS